MNTIRQMTRQWTSTPKARTVVGIAVALAISVAAFLTWRAFGSGKGAPGENDAVASDASAGPPLEVQLTEEKTRFAEIRIAKASRRRIRETRIVPGKLAYDAARYLEITAPVECVVREVLVEPGQTVEPGAKLVTLSSSQIGKARDEVLQREAEWELSRAENVWTEEIFNNVAQLLEKFSQHLPLEQVEKELETRALGGYRERLVAAYSKLLLAERVSSSSDELEQKGVVSKRLLEERRSNREVAAATFKGACESARFEAMRDRSKVRAAEMQAQRMLAISRDHLAALLGPQGTIEEPKNPPAAATAVRENGEPDANLDARPGAGDSAEPAMDRTSISLSEFIVRAPFAGRIERRHVVVTARVAEGKSLITLADTTKLWVEAEIHERDWRALENVTEGDIVIRVPALGERSFLTKVRYVGAEVSAESKSVPLVTEVENSEGRLKPGMFVWVEAPLGPAHEACVVPAGAIMRHEGKAFVFVPLGENRFRRVDVEAGLETSGDIEIRRGLEPDQSVVDRGAFYLKSELLLDKEAD